jgi:hypothetical protein
MISLMTVAQVAEHLQCSPSYVRLLMQAAEINDQLNRGQRLASTVPPRLRPLLHLNFPRPIRLSQSGRMVRIPADELEQWMKLS